MKIILSVALTMLLLGCSDDSKQEMQGKLNKHIEVATKKATELTKESIETVKEVASDAQEMIEDTANDAAEALEETTQEVQEKVAPTPTASNDGVKLYQSQCLTCHGANAEKKALTKSQVIQGWSVTKLKDALSGYKNKTYGASMKTIMEGKTKNLSDADIDALAEYISKL
jgi:cytochrome c553